MQRAGVPCSMTWQATSACPASTSARWPSCWGALPLFVFLCFIRSSSAATVTPLSHTASRTIGRHHRRIGHASADTQRDRPGGNGSRLYEVNIWMWRYGRGRPRIEAERIRAERISESRTRAAETRKRRSEAAAAAGAAQGGGRAD
jgi:hypothetical protein